MQFNPTVTYGTMLMNILDHPAYAAVEELKVILNSIHTVAEALRHILVSDAKEALDTI